MLPRAVILRQLDHGEKIVQVARNVGVSSVTVPAMSRRHREKGLEPALHEKPRPG
jgi:transposase